MSWFRANGRDVLIQVRVVPRASRTEISGIVADAIKIRLQAPPVDGKANKALLAYLSKILGVSKQSISLETGESARIKTLRISDLSAEVVRTRLQPNDRLAERGTS